MNLASVIIVLQMALSLLATPNLSSNQQLQQQIFSFANQATAIATTALKQSLQTQISTMMSTSSANVSDTSITCSLIDIYGNPQFCPNQSLPSFCPASSTIRNWNSFANNYPTYQAELSEGVANRQAQQNEISTLPPDFTYDEVVQCGMFPIPSITKY